MSQGHRWHPIKDYETDPSELSQPELTALADVWNKEHAKLVDSDQLAEFNRKLYREWAIETGLIERLYAFDRGITQVLIERGIDASLIPHSPGTTPEGVASMIGDHEDAIEFIFACIKDEYPLSTSYIKQLHQLMTRNQLFAEGKDSLGRAVQVPLERGTYKARPNNPTRRDGLLHEYCPPEQVASEMDRLITLHGNHDDVAPEVESAWLHHRFAQIHPFQDGNGRVARALATLVMLKAGRFPLVVRSERKGDYLDALEEADRGDLRRLVRFFGDIQRRELVRAIGLSHQIGKTVRAESLILATLGHLRHQRGVLRQEWNAAKERTEDLRQIAEHRLNDVRESLEAELLPLLSGEWQAFVDGAADRESRSHYFRQQIVSTARSLEYFAGLESYRSWVRLGITNADHSHILFSFHGIGRDFRGVLACSSMFFQRLQTEANTRETGPVKSLSESLFQVNYQEDPRSIQDRFETWMEECIVKGLEMWMKANL